jgi:hypothetical protein
MGIALVAPPRHPAKLFEPDGHEVRDFVQRALCGPLTPRRGIERRREQRHPYPYPVLLTPLDGDDVPLEGEPIVVVGKHLSESGLDFYCHQPLPYRRVIASLECGRDEWVGLLLDLKWCRFTRFGWYENGGRFLGLAQVQPNLCRKTA